MRSSYDHVTIALIKNRLPAKSCMDVWPMALQLAQSCVPYAQQKPVIVFSNSRFAMIVF